MVMAIELSPVSKIRLVGVQRVAGAAVLVPGHDEVGQHCHQHPGLVTLDDFVDVELAGAAEVSSSNS